MNRNSLVGEPVKAMGWTLETGGKLVQQIGKNIMTEPDVLSARHQEALERFKDRFVLVGNFVDYEADPYSAEAKAVTEAIAEKIVDLKTEIDGQEFSATDDDVVVEVGVLDENYPDPKVQAGLHLASYLLHGQLSAKTGGRATYNSHFMIAKRPDLSRNITLPQAWRAVAEGLISIDKQSLDNERYRKQIAVAVVDPDQAIEFFRGVEFTTADLMNGGHVILRDVSPVPSDNLLLPPNARVFKPYGQRLIRHETAQPEAHLSGRSQS